MRRQEKQVSDRENIDRIIRKSLVCRIGLAKNNKPYVVPVSFGYDGQAIYLHTAETGMKIDYITANNHVCFEFESNVTIQGHKDNPCSWSFSFQSVIGFGTVKELSGVEEKIEGLKVIMQQYSDRPWDFSEVSVGGLRVWKIVIESLTGKQSRDFSSPRLVT